VADWVRAHVVLVPEDVVGYGAHLHTDVLLLDHVDEHWVVDQGKAVADSLDTENDSIV